MSVQLDDIREATEGFGIPIVESETDEADDVIATLAVQGRDKGMDVFLVTGDKDFLQIVANSVQVFFNRGVVNILDVSQRVDPDQRVLFPNGITHADVNFSGCS